MECKVVTTFSFIYVRYHVPVCPGSLLQTVSSHAGRHTLASASDTDTSCGPGLVSEECSSPAKKLQREDTSQKTGSSKTTVERLEAESGLTVGGGEVRRL